MKTPPKDTLIEMEEEKIDLSDQQWGDGILLILFWLLAGGACSPSRAVKLLVVPGS